MNEDQAVKHEVVAETKEQRRIRELSSNIPYLVAISVSATNKSSQAQAEERRAKDALEAAYRELSSLVGDLLP